MQESDGSKLGKGSKFGEGDGTKLGISTSIDFVDGVPDGAKDGVGERNIDGSPDGSVDGVPDGVKDGVVDGNIDGSPDGSVDGAAIVSVPRSQTHIWSGVGPPTLPTPKILSHPIPPPPYKHLSLPSSYPFLQIKPK